MSLEIRARIALEVSKLQANAKVVIGQFKAMGTSAERFQNNVDHYAKRSLDSTKKANAERLKDTTKVGNAISAQEKKIADDRYSTIMQSARRAQKDLNKLELEKVRPGGGDANLGVRGRPQARPVYAREEKEQAAVTVLTASMRKEWEKAYAAKEKAAARAARVDEKVARDASKENQKRIAEGRAYTDQMRRQRQAVIDGLKKTEAQAQKTGKSLALQDYFKSEEFERKLASTRYALYDVSRRAAIFGAAIGGAFALGVKSAIEFESAFTSVERTTQLTLNSNIPEVRAEAQRLRDTLIQLTTEIPVAFADITEIATLGAQLGIDADKVDDFAETVAKFSAITGVAVDQAALSFGRLGELMNVDPSQFENLSSAIVFAGINAVATDAEILKMSESIAAASAQAGFAAADTIGFATALASLKVRPEEARGVLLRLFRDFDLSVSAGGSKLNDLASLIGKTSDEAAALWKQDPSQFVESFLKSTKASGRLNEVITALGITNTREARVITVLANNMDVLTSSLADSREQFLAGTFSSESYALVVDDIASKITILQNSIAALGAAFGQVFMPALGPVIDILQGIVEALTNAPMPVKVLITILGGLVAGFALITAAIAGGVAGLLALKLAFDNLGGSSIKAGLGLNTLRQLVISLIPSAAGATTIMGAMAAQGRAVATSFAAASGAAKAFQASLGIIGIVSAVAATVWTMANAMGESSKKAEKLADSTFEAAGGLDAFRRASEEGLESGATVYGEITASVQKLNDEQIEERRKTLESNEARARLTKNTEDGAKAYSEAKEKLEDFNREVAISNGLIEESTIKFTENTKEVIANALAKIDTGGESPLNIFTEIANFEATGLPPAVQRSLDKAGIDFVEVLNGSIEAAMSGEMTAVEYMEQQFANADLDFAMVNSRQVTEFINKMKDAGATTDGLISFAEKANQTGAVLDRFLGGAGESAEETEEDFAGLNDMLRQSVGLLTASDIAENRIAEALDTLAQGAIETSGELDGFGDAARTNVNNFASFMNAAVEASIAAGEGTSGAFRRMIDGLNGLDQAGVDTSDMFVRLRTFAVNNLALINPALIAVKDQLAASPNLQGMKDIINGFYAARIAAEGWSIQLNTEWQKVMAMFSATSYVPQIQKGTSQAKSALDKLAEAVKRAFKVNNLAADVQAGLDDLSKSLQDNGKKFDIYSEEGRSNISSLSSLIESLMAKSGGNVTAFANDLASLRAALVRTGAPASALKVIDTVTKQIGKTGKASKKNVDQFAASLRGVGTTERELLRVDKAIKKIGSSIREGLSARFAQGNAIDSLSLAWLNVSDAAEAAQDSIDDATKSIRDAKLEIDETNASIAELTGDKGKLEYQLGIALKYGDIIRAEEIRASIAKIDAEVAQKQADITDANQQISDANAQISRAQGQLGLGPDLRQEIERRNTLQDIAGLYGDVAAGMIANAKPGEDLNAIIAKQVAEFEANARQMGFTEEEVQKVSKALRDELTVAIKNVPKEIKTTAKVVTDPALSNVKSFVTQANAALNQIRDKIVTVTTIYQSGGGSSVGVIRRASGGLVTGPGSGTSDSIAARLSNGEYVVKAAAVKHYGVDFFNALNQMQSAPASMGPVNVSSGGSQTVYLSPEDRQLLRQAIDRPVALYTDNATIAQSANAGNQILAQRGIR